MRDRLYIAGYVLVLLVAGLGLRHMWQRHMDMILLETEDGISDSVNQLNGLLAETSSHVNMLRISAETALNDLATKHQVARGYYHHLKMSRDAGGYCTADDMSASVHSAMPAISGLGPVPPMDSAAGQEITMALLLGPQFFATQQNIPSMAWAYYTSAARFIAIFPFATCKEFHFTDESHDHEFFSLGRPAVNPTRAQFWTSAYVDEAGKGLMATIGAPVYDLDGVFRGTIDIDLTLKTLSQYIDPHATANGRLFIVNQQEQVLAHSSPAGADLRAAPQLVDLVPGYDASLRHLIFGSAHGFTQHGAQLFATRALQGAPWRLVYVTDQGALHWKAWRQSGFEIAGLLLLAGLIAAFELARRNSRRLKANNTDLALTHDQAQKARQEADSANRAKSLLMANVSHDLRTPLNAIIGFSDLMERQMFGALGSERYVRYAHDIKSSGELLLKIIDNLLDLSKAETGEYKLQEEVAEIPVLLEHCRHLVADLAEKAGIALVLKLAPDLPAVIMDQRAIQRVILNLLSNAIKFTRPGGRLMLSAFTDPEDRLTITVADSGAGIAKRDLDQLFRPFSRGASALKANSEGTGLGLSIVKSLIILHGGTVAMESKLGVGTIVTVKFPASRNWHFSGPIPALVLELTVPKAKTAEPAASRDAA